MKTTAALASLTAATSSSAVFTNDTRPLFIALGLVALHLVAPGVLLALYVCRPADREDLRKYIRLVALLR